jgi:membrane protease subunit HflK
MIARRWPPEGVQMPWNDNNGGGWKGGGGPWGSGPRQSGGPTPPDLEELLKRSQDRLKNMLPSGGRGNMLIAGAAVVAVIAIWLMNAVYQVQPEELGQELLFGKPKDVVSEPGLHFHFWPLETVEKVSTAQQKLQIGIGTVGTRRTAGDLSQMLSGDQNIIDVEFTVIWLVKDPKSYLFNVTDPEAFVRRVSESGMREYVGRTRADEVRTGKREELEDAVRTLVQNTMDAYGAGIRIIGIQLEKADPPAEVADAFEEVQRAQQDQSRFQREAEAYANRRLGEARGEASQVREQAQGYKESVIAQAQGEAARFVSVFDEYDKAKDVTRKRLFLETLERILKDSNKIILESGDAASGVVPYLPLTELRRGQTGTKETSQ